MKKVQIALALMVAVAYAAEEPKYSSNNAAKSSPSYEQQPPMPYKFAWAVKDEPSKNDYSHQQESDGKVTTGSYRVALPDGRVQIVTYRADENGYVADVKYEGEAKYPEYKPAASAPKPTYSAAPAAAAAAPANSEAAKPAYPKA